MSSKSLSLASSKVLVVSQTSSEKGSEEHEDESKDVLLDEKSVRGDNDAGNDAGISHSSE